MGAWIWLASIWVRVRKLLWFLPLLCLLAAQLGATVVTGTMSDALGNPATGTMTISWPTFYSTVSGRLIPRGEVPVPLGSGAFSIALEPNSGSGDFYTVRIRGPVVNAVETWMVEYSATPVDVSVVRVVVPPTPSAVLSLSQIPGLPASIITSGTFAVARMPDLNLIPTGLTPLRCLQTDASGFVTVAAAACGTGGGGGPADTDELSEGVVNLYFTNARARAAVSAGANLTYVEGTGVFSLPSFPYGSLSGTPSTFAPSAHDLLSSHTASGLTVGQFLKATGATTFGFAALTEADISDLNHFDGAYGSLSGVPSTFAPSAHVLDSATHTVSGLTTGHLLQATGATTFGFAALAEAQVTQHEAALAIAWAQLTGVPNLVTLTGAQTLEDKTIDGATNAITNLNANELSSGTVPVARLPNLSTVPTGLTATRCVETDGSGFLGVAAGPCGTGGGVSTDAVGTAELNDGSDTPSAGDLVRVDPGDTSRFEYIAPATLTFTESQISDLNHFDGAYGSLSGVPSTFAPAAHVLNSATHTVSGLTVGQFLKATGATSFGFAAITEADISDLNHFDGAYGSLSGVPSTFAPSAHVLDSASHTVSGLTTGHLLQATGAATFGFGALAEAQVTQHEAALAIAWAQLTGVPSTFAPAAHDILSAHTAMGLTAGQFLKATGATTFGFAALTEADISDLAHFDGAYGSLSGVPSTFAPAAHVLNSATHTVSGLTTGHLLQATGAATFGFAALAEAQVTQHEAALTITESQISDLSHFDGAYGSLSGVPSTFAPDLTGVKETDLADAGCAAVSFSATPTFNAATDGCFEITLTGDITSSTLSGELPGRLLAIKFTQDGSGGHTAALPPEVTGTCSIASGADQTTIALLQVDSAGVNLLDCRVPGGPDAWSFTCVDSSSIPTPPTGESTIFCNSADGELSSKNDAGTVTSLEGAGGGAAAAGVRQTFTSATSVTVTHDFGTLAYTVQCFDGSNSPIYWATVTTRTTSAVTVSFDGVSLSGDCVAVAGGEPGALDWSEITGKPSTFAPSAHVLNSATHTVSGLTVGQFLKATGATTFGFAAITEADISDLNHFDGVYSSLTSVPSTFAPSAHDILSAHTATGLTAGQFLKATGSTTFGFAALTEADISDLAHFDGAYGSLSGVPSTFAPSAHVLDSATHTVSGLTTGHVLQATGATTFGFAALPSHTHTESQISDLAHRGAGAGLELSGNNLQIAAGGVATSMVAAALKTETLSWSITNPVTGDSGALQKLFASAVTITAVNCSTDTGTMTIQFDERGLTTPNSAGTDVMTSTLVCDNDNQQTTSFTNAGIAAGALLAARITAVASSPTQGRMHVTYTID